MTTICKTGLLFGDRLLSHRQMEILYIVGEYQIGADRQELTDDLFERYGRASRNTRHKPLTAAERASLSRSIKRLIDVGLIEQRQNQLRLTPHGRQFMDGIQDNQAVKNYLRHYGPTWCKTARRIIGMEDSPRITVDDADAGLRAWMGDKYVFR